MDRYVVGVDFGTLSGRALVVRVARRRRGGHGGARVPPRRHRRSAAGHRRGAAAGLGAAGPGRLPRRAAPRGAGRAAPTPAIAPEQVIGIGIDFTACTVLPTLADGTPLCELSDLRDRPHAYVKLWKHHAAQPHADRINALAHERGEPWIGRYGGKISAEWAVRQGAAAAGGGPGGLPPGGALDRGGGLDRLAAVRRRDPQRLHRRLQGDLPGRPLSRPGTTWPRSTRTSPTSSTSSTIHCRRSASRAGGLTAEAAAWTGLPEGIAGRGGQCRRTRHRGGGAGRRPRPAGRHHGHVDLPRRERRRRWPRCPACAASSTAASAPACWGYEAGQSGVGDIFGWYVEHAAPRRATPQHETADRARRAAAGRRARAGRAGLVERQPVAAGQPRPQRPASSA